MINTQIFNTLMLIGAIPFVGYISCIIYKKLEKSSLFRNLHKEREMYFINLHNLQENKKWTEQHWKIFSRSEQDEILLYSAFLDKGAGSKTISHYQLYIHYLMSKYKD